MDYFYAMASFPMEVCLLWAAKQSVAVTSFRVSLLQENLTEHDQCLHIAGFVTRTSVLEAAYGSGELGCSLGLSQVAIPLAKQTSRVLVAAVFTLSSPFPLSVLRHVG